MSAPPPSNSSARSLAPSDKPSDKPVASTHETIKAPALPLRPTPFDLIRFYTPAKVHTALQRALPKPKYLSLPRRWFITLIAITTLILLLLIIILPIVLTGSNHKSVPFPKSGTIQRGEGTYYNPALGACGWDHSDNDKVAAVAWEVFDAASVSGNPNENPLCGRKVRVRREGGDRTVEVTVVDRCTGCKVEDLDMSPTVFNELAEWTEGRVRVEWAWV